jgi:ferric-dicitrate binding protein FerR (iron transport regulator)
MSNPNNTSHPESDIDQILKVSENYKYSFEASNDEAWNKFSAAREAEKQVPTPFKVYKNTSRLLRVAAAIAILAVGSWAFWLTTLNKTLDAGQFATNAGQIEQITMKDGSVITLNANSSVEYKVTEKSREIKLQGMAHFEVAKNPNAPFVIESNNNKVTVLGTGFDVQSYSGKPLQVTVNHGKVKVEKLSNSTTLESVILTKGMRVRENLNQANATDNRSQIFAVDSNVNLDAVKWESGNLIFTNAPIDDVVNAIETRYGKKLRARIPQPTCIGTPTITSNQTSDLQFTGEFKNTDEFSTVIKTIEIALGLQFEVK